ncbi:MAG TPA: hypothetical protein VGE74_03715 [Gemmata sp.]
MRSTFATLALVILLVSTGCDKSSSTAPATNPTEPGETRELTVISPGDQNVARNGTDKFSVRIDRDNFAGPVEVEIKNLPAGVSVVTPELTIPTGKDSVDVTVKASPNAKLVNDHKVQIAVRAKDQKNMKEATIQFDLDVKAE